MSEQCPDQDEACQSAYRSKVEHLIVARFYDAEERAEELYELGKLSQEDLVTLVATISKAKVDFYHATKSETRVADQRKIILDLQSAWNLYMSNIN